MKTPQFLRGVARGKSTGLGCSRGRAGVDPPTACHCCRCLRMMVAFQMALLVFLQVSRGEERRSVVRAPEWPLVFPSPRTRKRSVAQKWRPCSVCGAVHKPLSQGQNERKRQPTCAPEQVRANQERPTREAGNRAHSLCCVSGVFTAWVCCRSPAKANRWLMRLVRSEHHNVERNSFEEVKKCIRLR